MQQGAMGWPSEAQRLCVPLAPPRDSFPCWGQAPQGSPRQAPWELGEWGFNSAGWVGSVKTPGVL